MRIDIHAHYFPPEYLDLLSRLAGGAAEAEHRLPMGRLPLDERAELSQVERLADDGGALVDVQRGSLLLLADGDQHAQRGQPLA